MTAATASMVSQAAFNQSKPSLALKTQLAFSSNLFSTPSSNILNSVSPFLVFINLSVHKIYMQVFLKCFFFNVTGVSFREKSQKGLVVKCSMAAAEMNSRAAVSSDKGIKNPIIVIDNYDSFTYNLCQVSAFSS
jgi:anthranilate synthase component 2